MDRITQSLLGEFARDHSLDTLPEASQFEHFAAYLSLSRYHGEAFDTAELVTGSGGDTGIDAIAVLANGNLVTDVDTVNDLAERNGYLEVTFVFTQAERSSSFDMAKIGQFGFGVVDFFSAEPQLPRNEAVRQAADIMNAVYGLSSRFTRGNPTCRLFYVTTGAWTGDPNLEARKAAVTADLNSLGIFGTVEFSMIGAQEIQKLYNQSKNAISREFVFTEKIALAEIPGVAEAYLGVVPARTLLELIQDESANDLVRTVFYDNVRDWQDYNPVNDGMRETLMNPNERARFSLMNNGVTIIAKALRPTGNKLYIEDYQVVNGCQTSHVLWNNRQHIDDSVNVPLRVIATQDEEVIASIIRATNRQTPISEEQLIALSGFQKRLEMHFRSFDVPKRLYYERRSRQYNSEADVEKTRVISPANLIRSYASMFLSEPHRTTRNFRSLLERVGTVIFNEHHRLEAYYTAAFAFYRLDFLFRNLVIAPQYKPARYHLLFAFRLLVAPNDPPRANSHEMDRYCEHLVEVLWNKEKAEEVFRRAAEAVDRVAQGNFDRNFIRTQPFTEALEQQCRVLTEQ